MKSKNLSNNGSVGKDISGDFDNASLDVYVQMRLKQENEKRNSRTEIRIESLRIIGNLLIIFVLVLFIVSSFVQMILRAINGIESQTLTINSGYIRYYQRTIHNTLIMARFTTVLILIWLLLYNIVNEGPVT